MVKLLRVICALAGLFFGALLLGSIIPANTGWQEPDDGIELFVETNGVHVSLIVPMQAAGEDLSDLIRPGDLATPDVYGTHAMIGWGHEGVYRSGSSWAEVRWADILAAATGSDDVLLHVYHRVRPHAAAHRKAFRVTPVQYRHIIADIRRSFSLDAQGRSIASPAYGDGDVFYAATGYYSAGHTCNEWTAGLLRRAGVRIGIWTPLPGGVMRWF